MAPYPIACNNRAVAFAVRRLILGLECHFQVRAIGSERAVVDNDFLVLDPDALHMIKRLRCALDTTYDRIVETFLGFGTHLNGFGKTHNRLHVGAKM